MFKDNKEKNPFFIPALIATLIPVVCFVILFFFLFTDIFFNSLLAMLLIILILAVPFAAMGLSTAGLADARKTARRFKGCVFCLVIAFLNYCSFKYGFRPI